jgi:C_GCAxxG_C_C family probable redox protein
MKEEKEIIDSLVKAFQGEEEEKLWRLYRTETKEEELLRRIGRDAYEVQIKYRTCSQTSLYSLVLHLRPGGVIDPWQVVPGMNGLCVGIAAKTNSACGVLIGGIYALGMEFGRRDFYEPGAPKEAGPSNFQRCMTLCNELYEKFVEKYGCATCRQLQEKEYGTCLFDVGNETARKMAADGSLFDVASVVCGRIVQGGTVLAAEIILRERKQRTAGADFFYSTGAKTE